MADETITLRVNGRAVKVGKGFLDLSSEEQERTVNEIAAQLPPDGAGVMGFVNKGIATGVDAMVGAVNRPVNAAIRGAAGLVGVENPFQFGTQPTRDLMRGAGIYEERAPETLGQKAMYGAGLAAPYMVPYAGAARALSGAGGLTGAVAQSVNAPTVAAPVRSMAAEMMAGGGAAVGGEVGSKYGPVGRMAGEVVGALAGAVAPGGALRGVGNALGAAGRTLPGPAFISRAIAREIAPFTKTGGVEIARTRIRGLAQEPDAIAARISPDSPLSPAQQTGDPNLMALERTILERNPEMQPLFDAARRDAEAWLETQARQGTGPVSDAKEFIAARTQEVVSRLQAKVSDAMAVAQTRVDALSPQRAQAENSVIVRQEIDRAFTAARLEERSLWDKVPRQVSVPTANAKVALSAGLEEAGPVSADRIPSIARKWLSDSGFGESASVRDMHRLYSELRQVAREALGKTAPDEYTARQANMIADAILADMGATGPVKSEVGNLLNAARAYTIGMAETFGQGTVGRITGSTRAGGDVIDPALTLGNTVGRGGTAGGVAVSDIRQAAGPVVDEPIQDFMLGQLQRRGDVTARSADAFARSNPEILEQYPQLRSQIEGAGAALSGAERTAARVGGRADAIQDPQRAVGASFTSAKPGKEVVNAIFGAEKPIVAARQLTAQARRDTTGKALAGLKGGVFDYLMQRSAAGFGAEGERLISGNTLTGLLRDKTTRAAIDVIYSPAEVSRLTEIARQFRNIEMSRKSGTLDTVTGAKPNSLLSYIGGTFAARTGAQLGAGTSGASLRTASMATNRFNQIIQNLTTNQAEALLRQAITDPQLFRDLSMPMNTKSTAAHVERRLIEWLEGYAASQTDPAVANRKELDNTASGIMGMAR